MLKHPAVRLCPVAFVHALFPFCLLVLSVILAVSLLLFFYFFWTKAGTSPPPKFRYERDSGQGASRSSLVRTGFVSVAKYAHPNHFNYCGPSTPPPPNHRRFWMWMGWPSLYKGKDRNLIGGNSIYSKWIHICYSASYHNCMEHRPSWEANSHSAGQENLLPSWNPKVYCCIQKVPLISRSCVKFRNKLVFTVIANPSPLPQAGGPPLVGYLRPLSQCILTYPPYLEAVFSVRATRGIAMSWWYRDPLHMVLPYSS
jgi:hypothetical protein